MNGWTPFWRWTALGVLGALTFAWVAQSETHDQPSQRGPHQQVTVGPQRGVACSGVGTMVTWSGGDATRQVCINTPNGTLSVNPDGTLSVTNTGSPTAAVQRERATLQRQEAELQAQAAQLDTRIGALQARLNSLGN